MPVVGGEFDGKVVKFNQFASHLPVYPYRPQSIEVEAARLNVRFPKILEALLISGKRSLRDDAYIEAIGGEDFGNITRIALASALEEDSDNQLAIRVVYGGTNKMPLRSLSGLLPALVYMDSLQEAGVAIPQLQMIFADHISASANPHIELEQAKQESTGFSDLARDYVSSFFSELTPHVLMLRDIPIAEGTVFKTELDEISQIAEQVIPNSIRERLNSKDNGSGSGVYYGAAHILVHDISLPHAFVPILENQPAIIDPKAIISIGGRQEKFFYRLRHGIKPYLSSRYKDALTFQFFTRHQVPPYYMAADGDISIYDGINETPIGMAAKYDVDYLDKVTSLRGDLYQFLGGRYGK